ncbi:MAG: TIGR04552 family protein, partial [Bdellovibrionota bacterium]
MTRPGYLSKYLFDWDMFEVVTNGQSALDAKYFLGTLETKDEIINFLRGYGIDYNDPVNRAELFGNFQEALQFIKRYFLKEGNPEGLDLKIPNSIYMVTDIIELFIMATRGGNGETREERLWAELILKVIHTIIHVDKDLRAGYFSAVQTQVFDRFYKHLQREGAGQLFLGPKGGADSILLCDFQTKSKKTRESVLIKLLHKPENVAEELFDRVGMRIVTYNKLDVVRVIQFLIKKSIVTPHNIKPSRSINRLVYIEMFRRKYNALLKLSMKSNLREDEFLSRLHILANECVPINA